VQRADVPLKVTCPPESDALAVGARVAQQLSLRSRVERRLAMNALFSERSTLVFASLL
jgi:hypothetical protein